MWVCVCGKGCLEPQDIVSGKCPIFKLASSETVTNGSFVKSKKEHKKAVLEFLSLTNGAVY